MPAEEVVVEGRPVLLAEVRDLLESERQKRGEEGLSYEQKLAQEHATLFAKLPTDQAKKLAADLAKLGGKITEPVASKLADLAPTHPDDVRAVFAKDRVTPEKEEIDKIIEIIRGYQ
jgi:DNA-directed RNA polymerase subunit F